MTSLLLRLYDHFRLHRRAMTVWLVLSTAVLALLLLHIHYQEDISAFLPFGPRDRQSMRIYQQVAGANRIIVLVGAKEQQKQGASRTRDSKPVPDSLAAGVDDLVACLQQAGIADSLVTAQVDMQAAEDVAAFAYRHIPYFLTAQDYARMDSALADPQYVGRQLTNDKQQLLFPSGGLLGSNIGSDPLNLFTPVVERLARRQQQLRYELYDGYILTPDQRHAVVTIDSPYGSSETEHNSLLIQRISRAAQQTSWIHPSLSIRLTGGPVIAVDNARQIKTDSMVSVTLAVVLILLLLWFSLRSVRNIVLIAVSIAWGWLFALGALSLVHHDVSVIVIGISSVILGIAINYPLHLVAHLSHTPDVRKALRELIAPLLVGNITTIGAFLALTPLRSVALRDLGLFASFLLLGTIVFVFVFLPHLVKPVATRPSEHHFALLDRISNVSLHDKRWLVIGVAVITVVLSFFSFRTRFDTNLSHVNYMSDEQKADMQTLQTMVAVGGDTKTVYVVSSGRNADGALRAQQRMAPVEQQLRREGRVAAVNSCAPFLCSVAEQRTRLARWQSFVSRYREVLTQVLAAEGGAAGFDAHAFDDFFTILGGRYPLRPASYFSPLTRKALAGTLVRNEKDGTWHCVDALTVRASQLDQVENSLRQAETAAAGVASKSAADVAGDNYHFEIGRLNSVIADTLNDNFNYIGWACGLIVFFFLWFSMGSIELALLSFLPMAVSWIWILGLMGLLGINFNIVNIILATFIFGQGDDYTIFMTEGCQYEYATGRRMLASYQHSILLSALIMFIGMGSLILARHPALHSLAEVTIVGMFSVVVMAWLLPPFFFRWLTMKNGVRRRRPLTWRSLLFPRRYPEVLPPGASMKACQDYVRDVYYYYGTDIVKSVRHALRHYEDYVTMSDDGKTITVRNDEYGAVELLMSLSHPDTKIMKSSRKSQTE
uniref:MMPL family transporter n=1 Tax=Prevotella sp. TaxID=59823 RepID=UPI004024EDB0